MYPLYYIIIPDCVHKTGYITAATTASNDNNNKNGSRRVCTAARQTIIYNKIHAYNNILAVTSNDEWVIIEHVLIHIWVHTAYYIPAIIPK